MFRTKITRGFEFHNKMIITINNLVIIQNFKTKYLQSNIIYRICYSMNTINSVFYHLVWFRNFVVQYYYIFKQCQCMLSKYKKTSTISINQFIMIQILCSILQNYTNYKFVFIDFNIYIYFLLLLYFFIYWFIN